MLRAGTLRGPGLALAALCAAASAAKSGTGARSPPAYCASAGNARAAARAAVRASGMAAETGAIFIRFLHSRVDGRNASSVRLLRGDEATPAPA
jgi:hypothetical protein